MLTIEDIKKGCEFAEGFEIKKDSHSDDNDSLVHVDEGLPLRFLTRKNVENTKRWKNSIYPLFLQRVIEGINRAFEGLGNGTKYITIESDFVQVGDIKSPRVYEKQFELCDYDIDQAKEQAIKYILDKLK